MPGVGSTSIENLKIGGNEETLDFMATSRVSDQIEYKDLTQERHSFMISRCGFVDAGEQSNNRDLQVVRKGEDGMVDTDILTVS